MLPTKGDVHVNRPLTQISIAMLQRSSNFIAADVFPILTVAKQSDAFFSYDMAYWNRDQMKLRAPATESEGNGYRVDPNNTYYAPVYAFHHDIPDQVAANADEPINLDREATEFCTLVGLIKREKLFSSAFMTGGVWSRDYDGASANGANQSLFWNDVDSTPIKDIWDAKQQILSLTGFEPNRLVLGYPVYNTLINHPEVIDRVKYGQTPNKPAQIDVPELEALFKIDKIVVMRSIENTAAEGATADTSFIGGKKALLAYAAPSPGLMTASAGYIFSWNGALGAGPQGNRIKRFRMEHLACDRVEIEMAFDMKRIAPDLGAFWDNIVE